MSTCINSIPLTHFNINIFRRTTGNALIENGIKQNLKLNYSECGVQRRLNMNNSIVKLATITKSNTRDGVLLL